MFPENTKLILIEVSEKVLHAYKFDLEMRFRENARAIFKDGNQNNPLGEYSQGQMCFLHLSQLGERLWNCVQQSLERMHFSHYERCDEDICAFLKDALEGPYEHARKELYRIAYYTNSGTPSLRNHFDHILKGIGTEVKIFCTGIEALKEKEKNQAGTVNLYHLEGPNSRVNINSNDSSVNTVNESELFVKLRSAIEEQIADRIKKEQLLKVVEEGSKLQKATPIFDSWFVKFMGMASDSFGVIQPFLACAHADAG